MEDRNLTWTIIIVQCIFVVFCKDPTPENGQIIQSNINEVYLEGSTVSFTCDHGYTLSESVSSTCNGTGLWNPNPPSCIEGTSNLIDKNVCCFYLLNLLAKQ